MFLSVQLSALLRFPLTDSLSISLTRIQRRISGQEYRTQSPQYVARPHIHPIQSIRTA
jgi:hypothetical protein